MVSERGAQQSMRMTSCMGVNPALSAMSCKVRRSRLSKADASARADGLGFGVSWLRAEGNRVAGLMREGCFRVTAPYSVWKLRDVTAGLQDSRHLTGHL